MEELKDKDQRLTKERNFGTTIGQLRVYNDDLTPRDYDWYPKVVVSAAENLDKFQYGIIKIAVEDCEGAEKKEYLVQVDGLMAIVYNVYAKTLNDLRRPSFRDKTVRMWGFFKILLYKIKKRFGE